MSRSRLEAPSCVRLAFLVLARLIFIERRFEVADPQITRRHACIPVERHIVDDGQVPTIRTRDGMEHDGATFHGAAHRAYLVQAVARRHDSEAAHSTEGRAQSGNAASNGRRENRAARIGANGEAYEPGSSRGGGTG